MRQCTDTAPAVQPSSNTGFIRPDALYLHVPFCFHKCHYCDFYSLVEPDGADRQQPFLARLTDELHWLAQRYDLTPDTVFIGGGTPTLLRPELWRRLLDLLHDLHVLTRVTEFTVEANPETVTPELAALLAAGGVNRVSLGAQSFSTAHLQTLERWHDPRKVTQAMDHFRSVGVTNLNLDLIFAVPGQTMADLDADLDTALALEPTHLSCYALIFEPHTPLTKKRELGLIRPVPEALERRMYQRVLDRLESAGFEHYEISNWALKPGSSTGRDSTDRDSTGRGVFTYRCLHNLAYWHNRCWLGAGPSAATHVTGRRWKNLPHLGRYLESTGQPPTTDDETLDPERRLGEELMLRLRLIDGAELDWLEPKLDGSRRRIIDDLIAQQMLIRTATHLKLSRRGLFVADAVIAQLL